MLMYSILVVALQTEVHVLMKIGQLTGNRYENILKKYIGTRGFGGRGSHVPRLPSSPCANLVHRLIGTRLYLRSDSHAYI